MFWHGDSEDARGYCETLNERHFAINVGFRVKIGESTGPHPAPTWNRE